MSALLIGRMVSALFWGVVADRYGRRPVLFIALGCIAVFSIAFGFSTSFWAAFTFRFDMVVRMYDPRYITAQISRVHRERGVDVSIDQTRAPLLPSFLPSVPKNDDGISAVASASI